MRRSRASERLEWFKKIEAWKASGDAVAGQGLGRSLGFPTLNLGVDGLRLPPRGVYAVSVATSHAQYRGIANLGLAPTVRTDGRALLEVFLFDCHGKVETKNLEVSLIQFIRPERKFEHLDALKQQIQLDVAVARHQIPQLIALNHSP